MALSLFRKPKQSLWDKVVDVFDANTEADKYRRAQSGQPVYYSQQQAQRPITNPLVKRNIFNKVWDQVNPYDNNRTFKQATPTNSRSVFDQYKRNLDTTRLGLARSAYGTIEGLGGLYDLASPGTGNNRVTKFAQEFGKLPDVYVEKNGYSTGLYKSSQFLGDMATFAAGGAPLLKGTATVTKGAKYIPGATKAIGAVNRAATNGPRAGRLAAKTAQYLTKPNVLSDIVADTAISSGQRSAKGQDVNIGTVGLDAGLSTGVAVGLGATGYLAKKGAPILAKGASDLIQSADAVKPAVKQTGKVLNQTAKGSMNPIKLTQKLDELDYVKKAWDRATDAKTRRTLAKDITRIHGEIRELNKQSSGGYLKLGADDVDPKAPQVGKTPKVISREEASAIAQTNPEELANAISAGRISVEIPKVAAKSKVVGKTTKPKVVAKKNEVQAPIKQTEDLDTELQRAILGDQADPNFNVSKGGQLVEKLSINRQLRKLTKPIENLENRVVRGSLESGNRILRTPGRTAVGVSRQAGRTVEELDRLGKFQGQKQFGDELAKSVARAGEEATQAGARPQAIAAALDPELNLARGGKAPELTALEQAEVSRLRKIIDLTHEGQYQIGLLDEKRYNANKGKYFPRDFTEFFNDSTMRNISKRNNLETSIFKKRKGIEDIPKEVLEKAQTDPYYLTALRVQQYNKNKAVVDQVSWLAKNGTLSDVPKKGYVPVPTDKAYGQIQGKYILKEQLEDIEGFIYETNTAQHIVALLTAYDRNPLRKGLKASKTVYNPGVRLGNRTFNYLTSSLSGVNPITFTKNYARGAKMMKQGSPEFLEATKAGIFGSSIIDKELYRTGNVLDVKSKNVLKRANETASTSYGKVDDEGKMAMYLTFRERGLSAQQAAERTRRAMQNYDMVGNLFDLGAKTPIGGNAFVRFSSELLRIAHNTAIDNPARAVGAVASVVGLTTLASQMSGETPEDRKTREERLGAARVPFTNQSLEVQTPWGAVNVGRLLGVTTYNDLTGGFQEDTKRLLPFQPPITKGEDGWKFNPNFVTADLLVGPLMGQAIDKDFRGKSIKDPENTGQIREDLPLKDQVINRAKTAVMSYVPLANEVDSLISAAKGDKNFYGKERSFPQAALRTAGIKVEQYGPEQASDQRRTNEYYQDKKEIDKLAKNMAPEAAEAYKRLTGYYKNRKDVPNEFQPGETRKQKEAVYNFPEDKWKDLTSHPELYDLMVEKKKRDSNRVNEDGKRQPIQPEYDNRLSREFRIQLINNKSLAPGEDVEADERMYSNPEWDSYMKLKDEYTALAKQYYPERDGEFVDELVKHVQAPYPKKGPTKAAYDEAYAKYAQGQGPKPEFNEQVLAEKEAYQAAKLKWTNTERKARGLPPISPEVWDNVTFGFESDEEKVYKALKYGKGYGGYGYGSGGRSFTVSPKSVEVTGTQPKIVKPSVSSKKRAVAPRYAISGNKPKVTLKKLRI